MKLTKGQIDALVEEAVEKLSGVNVLEIGPAKLKTDWDKIQNLDVLIRAKNKEIEDSQAIVNRLEEELETLETSIRNDKKNLEKKYNVKVNSYYNDYDEGDDYVLRVKPNLGSDIHSKLQRQITLLSIDENIDGLTADQLINKIVDKHLKP